MYADTFQEFLMHISPLTPPFWLCGGQAETIYAKLICEPLPAYRREVRSDSLQQNSVAYDFIDSDSKNTPLVVLFHGLEGSSRSHYAVSMMNAVQQLGWNGVVVHFRSCGGIPAQTLYHAGDTREVQFALEQLAQDYPHIYATGVSLGGNVLAKHLGEQGCLKHSLPIEKAAVISAPADLPQSDIFLSKGLTRLIYTPYFLHTLLKKVPPSDTKIRTLADFDNHYTAPLNHFADKDDYYQQAQAKPHLRFITVPTLLLNAASDPFLPAPFLPKPEEVSPAVCLLQPKRGGHVGFVSGNGKGHLRWLPETVLRFFQTVC